MSEPDDPSGSTPRVSLVDEQDRPTDVAALERLAERALDAARVPPSHSLSIALVERGRIADLKARYYGEPGETDVLAFPMDPLDAPAPAILGDVVICVDVAAGQAPEFGRDTQGEVELLLVHGILHLAGHDHGDAATERAMTRETARILKLAREEAS